MSSKNEAAAPRPIIAISRLQSIGLLWVVPAPDCLTIDISRQSIIDKSQSLAFCIFFGTIVAMTPTNPHLGSTLESWLDEEGIRGEVTTAAIKAVVAHQLGQAMAQKGITKSAMAEQMKTSRAQLDRLLDPDNGGVTLETLQKAAKVLGRSIRVELI